MEVFNLRYPPKRQHWRSLELNSTAKSQTTKCLRLNRIRKSLSFFVAEAIMTLWTCFSFCKQKILKKATSLHRSRERPAGWHWWKDCHSAIPRRGSCWGFTSSLMSRAPGLQHFLLALIIAGVLLACMFPVWPMWAKVPSGLKGVLGALRWRMALGLGYGMLFYMEVVHQHWTRNKRNTTWEMWW